MITLCLGGDVMTGRGMDQILPSPGNPRLWESRVTDARDYVELAERINGPVPRPVTVEWPWGDALPLLQALSPDLRIVNLETSITGRGEPAAGKAVHYRMNPANIGCLTAANLDACMLANNHTLDFGSVGLTDTLHTLSAAPLAAVGAGHTLAEATHPAMLPIRTTGRVIVVACGAIDSGIPASWAATDTCPGVHLLPNLGHATADLVADGARQHARPGDIVIVSIHWGSNWGYHVPGHHVRFAHRLIDAGVHLVYGHSSHHPLPLEIYRDKLILYGCGDLIDDYEGIGGYQQYRDDLRLLYLPTLDPTTGNLTALRLAAFQTRQLRLRHADPADTEWLRDLISRLSRRELQIDQDGLLQVQS